MGKNLNQISTRSNMRIGLLYYFLSAKGEVRMEALCKFNSYQFILILPFSVGKEAETLFSSDKSIW